MSLNTLIVSVCFLLTFNVNATDANVYTWIDENGIKHYSDTPKQNAIEHNVKLKTQNNISIKLPIKKQLQPMAEVSYQFSITQPRQQATIRNNNGHFNVQAFISPRPPKESLFQLYLNGKANQLPKSNPYFYLTDIDRGEHKIVVKALLPDGSIFSQTPETTIFLHKTIVNP